MTYTVPRVNAINRGLCSAYNCLAVATGDIANLLACCGLVFGCCGLLLYHIRMPLPHRYATPTLRRDIRLPTNADVSATAVPLTAGNNALLLRRTDDMLSYHTGATRSH